MENVMNVISIIGGADGPTSVFVGGEVGKIATVVSIVIGLLLCFFGLKVMKILVTLVGFVVGAGIGIGINGAADISGLTSLLVIFGAAILLAVLSYFLYRVGIFITAFGMIGSITLVMIDSSVSFQLMIAMIVTLVLAILCMIFMEPAVIVITGLSGGLSAGNGIAQLTGLNENMFIGLGIGIVLAVFGIVVQFMMQSRKVGKKEKLHSKKVKEKDSMESEVEKARMLLADDDELEDADDADDADDIDVIEEDLDEKKENENADEF